MPPKRRTPPVHYIDAKEVEVKDVPGKGLGVVAVVDLPRNSRLPYLGKLITQKTYDKFVERSHRAPSKHYTDYIMNTTAKDADGEPLYVDANPRYYGSENWIASRVNEPGPKEAANMVIRWENRMPVLVTTKKIKAGKELLLHYGQGWVREYEVGRRATKPDWLK